MTSKLNLDLGAVLLARELARRAGEPVTQLALDPYHGVDRAGGAAAGRA
jgi:hypothetical protein